MLFTRVRAGALSVLFVTGAWAQAQPAFEVASIKKSESLDGNAVMSGQMRIGMTIDAARVDIRSFSLTELIRAAYRVRSFQISGPEWLAAQRFDIIAKMPAGAAREQVPEMLQALLAERFKLTLHRSTTEQPVYALVVAKGGPKLKESPPGDDPFTSPAPGDGSAQVRASANSNARGVISTASPNGAAKMITSETGMRIEATRMNTTGMTELLGRFVDRPIVDQTGLTGKYDFTVEVGMDDVLHLARAAGISVPPRAAEMGHASEPGTSSVFAAIEQYGLRLEARKAPVELLVIDQVEKNPTVN